jgi:hypothetical protein
MRLAFLNILILISTSLLGQSFIGLTKTDCKTEANKIIKANGFASYYKESESSLIFLISRSSNPYTTLTLYFNKEGVCNLQTQSYSCDTCMYYAYQKIIRNKKYSWKKQDDGTFYSLISKGIILDVPKDTFLIFRIRKS